MQTQSSKCLRNVRILVGIVNILVMIMEIYYWLMLRVRRRLRFKMSFRYVHCVNSSPNSCKICGLFLTFCSLLQFDIFVSDLQDPM